MEKLNLPKLPLTRKQPLLKRDKLPLTDKRLNPKKIKKKVDRYGRS